jgi:CheY-like chemotaxis protein
MSTFLVIEDSITIRKLVELAFRGSSVEVDFATSGAEGLAKIKARSPRVVLMDYVLPDMKGIEICTKLASSEGPPPLIMVMSARMEEVKQLFAPFPFVIDFVTKPFKAGDIVERVIAALARDGSKVVPSLPVVPTPSLLPSADREAAAFALFAQLRPRLAQIPTWAAELGDTPPAKFYARRILTPDIVDRLLESLLPVLRDRIRKTSPVADELVSDVVLEGRIGTLSPYEILAVSQRLQRTGEVVVGAHGEIVTFLRDGKVVLATSRNPTEWLQDLSLDLSGVPADAMRKAVDEQTATGKPVLVTLAELGCLPPCDLSGLLNEQGKRVLKRVLGRLGPGTPFAVRARATLPLYVDAYGRGLWFRQVVLERLRDDPTATGELPAVTGDAVFERRGGFSKRLLQFELVPSERRVLALVDGNATVRSIAERTALGLPETCEALQRLEAIELLGRRDSVRPASESPPSIVARQVAILEPDVEGFQRPLERLLAERPGTYTLVSVDNEQDVFSAIRRVRPALVILNVTAHGVAESARTARAVRGSDELRDLLLVAVQDLPSEEDAGPLSEAGFDAVLSKPVCYSDIERLLVA